MFPTLKLTSYIYTNEIFILIIILQELRSEPLMLGYLDPSLNLLSRPVNYNYFVSVSLIKNLNVASPSYL